MFHVFHCGDGKLLAQSHAFDVAFNLAKDLMTDDGFDTYVTDNSRGYSKIIGFGSTGFIPDAPDPTDPCTRGGSCMTGREH